MSIDTWVSNEQVLELAALRDDKLFFFYDDLKCLDQEPHGYRTAYEDQIGVTEEVYCRLTFCNCHVRSVSLAVSESVCLSVCLCMCVCQSVRVPVICLTFHFTLKVVDYENHSHKS